MKFQQNTTGEFCRILTKWPVITGHRPLFAALILLHIYIFIYGVLFFLGTVEFIMDKEQNFYFMEMNTRLQVFVYFFGL